MKLFLLVFKKGVAIVLVAFILIALVNAWVVLSTFDSVHHDLNALHHTTAGLVLGTSPKLQNGNPNPFFKERILSAASLYIQNKVDYLIVSGDNRTKYYNEPREMKEALMELGVPENKIVQDTAGIKTYLSIDRCKNVFGEKDITVVTQSFHSFRAVYISNALGVEAQAYATNDIPFRQSFPVVCREFFARPKAIYDIYINN